ncbi:AI-2E family transporter [Rhodopirellula sp. JC740]|uniref:AI-2E family transporter n=1 Tax=Rhodopirellula halodulae TaxID=2894198 RepID=A0ABS8NEL0_9BACT|nr:AI-2E family transporter [Rhodopirellula sp. JC740]MCC9641991.1 AI-2E family transporter [Rhodopirellula sp. JC740]
MVSHSHRFHTILTGPRSERSKPKAESLLELERLSSRVKHANIGIWICAILLSLYALYVGRNLFMPILVAVFAYLTLRPVIRGMGRMGIPSGIAAGSIMLVMGLSVGTIGYVLSGPAQEILQQIPGSLPEVKDKLGFIFEHLETVNQATEDISDTADQENLTAEEKPVPVEIKQPAWTTTSPLIAGTGNAVSFISIAAVLLFFLMAGGDSVILSVVSILPSFSSKRRFMEVLVGVQDGLSSYLAWVTCINACLGVCIGTAMWALGMPSPLLWGVAAMLLNFIPMVGAMLGIAAVFFVALVNVDHVSYAFIVAGAYAALTGLEGQFITPMLLGKSMRLSSVLVFLSIVVWGWMWGIVGVFLAVPILIAIVMVVEKLEATSPVQEMINGTVGKNVPAD